MAPISRTALIRLVLPLVIAPALGGCIVSNSPYQDLMRAQPAGSAFSRALFHDYADLARSFGIANAPTTTSFDASSSLSISNLDSAVADVANAYASKALLAAKGEQPLPEPAPIDNEIAEKARLRLLRALDRGRTQTPALAARAQANYDCWVLNSPVDQLAAAAAQCQRAFNASLARLGGGTVATTAPTTAPAPTPTSEPASAPTSAPASANQNTTAFTAYFRFNSAQLTPADMTVLRQAIETARAGGQSRITVVGHTDTSRTETRNKTLSLDRAKAVTGALVRLGARSAAIQTSGVGESDPAVQTPQGVRKPRNRRVVITLVP